jgi:molecular chaperone DnaK
MIGDAAWTKARRVCHDQWTGRGASYLSCGGKVSYDLGIDVGTSFTASAIARNGHVEVLSLGSVGDSVPTAIYLREDGLEVVGESANRRGLTDPGRVARGFKRRLGDPQPIILGGAPYSPQALFAKMLRWVVEQATERHGGGPQRVTASHPANWGPYKLELFQQALQLADLEGSALISEPHAAALAYASREHVADGSVIAVYDQGGGTFDAAILQKQADTFHLLGQSVGIEHLGGMDFDEAVVNHVITRLGPAWPSDDIDDPAIMQNLANLRRSCVEAKEALSSDQSAFIPVLLPGVSQNVELNRDEFEASIRPRVEDSIHALRRAIDGSGVGVNDLTSVLLVGGSSRIPLVSQMVSAELGRPVAIDTDPKFPIAKGSALAALSLGGDLAYPATKTEQQTIVVATPPTAEPVSQSQAAQPQGAEPQGAQPQGAQSQVEQSQVAPPQGPPPQGTPPQAILPLDPPLPSQLGESAAQTDQQQSQQPAAQAAPLAAAGGPPSSPAIADRPTDPPSKGKRPMLLALAAVALIVIGGAFVANTLFGGSDDDTEGDLGAVADDSDGLLLDGDGTSNVTPDAETVTFASPEGMVVVSAGTYTIGADGQALHAASRVSTLEAEFFIDATEVTNGQYTAFIAATGAPSPDDWSSTTAPTGQEDHPVDGVRVLDAETFCGALGKRLPTESEWEITARGPSSLLYPWGDDQNAVPLPGSGTYPVGSVAGNVSAFGAFDMVGNVWEWVGDAYEPIGDQERILRGGANGLLRDSAYRLIGSPENANIVASAGFRCAATQTDASTDPFDFSNAGPIGQTNGQDTIRPSGPLGELLFEDDFQNPESGWPQQETEAKLTGYHPPDFYHVQLSAPSNWIVSTRGVSFGDVSLATEVQVDNTESTNGVFRYGLVIRASEEGFVAFTVSPRTGRWSVLQAQPGVAGLEVDEVATGSAPSVKGFGSNDLLRIDASGNEFSFSVNNTVLAYELPVDASGRGDVGFYVETFDETKAHVHFDEITVRELTE